MIQDSDDEEVVEIDLTEEPVSPEPDVEISEGPEINEVNEGVSEVNEQVNEVNEEVNEVNAEVSEMNEVSEEPAQLEDDVEPPASVHPSEPEVEPEPLSLSSSKTLFERLEEALMSSSTAMSSSSLSTASVTASHSSALTSSTSMHKSSKSLEKLSSTVVEESTGNELNVTDKRYSSTVIDRIGKVLTLEKKSRSASHKKRKSSVSESVKGDKHNSGECVTETTFGTNTRVDQSNNVGSVGQVNCSDKFEKSVVAVATKVVAEVLSLADRRHKRSKKSKEKLPEPAVAATEKPTESEICEASESKTTPRDMDERPPTDVDALGEDGKLSLIHI